MKRLTDDGLNFGAIKCRFDGTVSTGQASPTPALPRDRSRSQLSRAEQDGCQTTSQLPVVGPVE